MLGGLPQETPRAEELLPRGGEDVHLHHLPPQAPQVCHQPHRLIISVIKVVPVVTVRDRGEHHGLYGVGGQELHLKLHRNLN